MSKKKTKPSPKLNDLYVLVEQYIDAVARELVRQRTQLRAINKTLKRLVDTKERKEM
jgi:quinol monooxygenase YgiN